MCIQFKGNILFEETLGGLKEFLQGEKMEWFELVKVLTQHVAFDAAVFDLFQLEETLGGFEQFLQGEKGGLLSLYVYLVQRQHLV